MEDKSGNIFYVIFAIVAISVMFLIMFKRPAKEEIKISPAPNSPSPSVPFYTDKDGKG